MTGSKTEMFVSTVRYLLFCKILKIFGGLVLGCVWIPYLPRPPPESNKQPWVPESRHVDKPAEALWRAEAEGRGRVPHDLPQHVDPARPGERGLHRAARDGGGTVAGEDLQGLQMPLLPKSMQPTKCKPLMRRQRNDKVETKRRRRGDEAETARREVRKCRGRRW